MYGWMDGWMDKERFSALAGMQGARCGCGSRGLLTPSVLWVVDEHTSRKQQGRGARDREGQEAGGMFGIQ